MAKKNQMSFQKHPNHSLNIIMLLGFRTKRFQFLNMQSTVVNWINVFDLTSWLEGQGRGPFCSLALFKSSIPNYIIIARLNFLLNFKASCFDAVYCSLLWTFMSNLREFVVSPFRKSVDPCSVAAHWVHHGTLFF